MSRPSDPRTSETGALSTDPFDPMELLADLEKSGDGVGLHRMARLAEALTNKKWISGLDAIKITGSNGKGSVCAMLASIFDHLPVRYGLYTSPHLRHFSERIVVDGRPIPAEALRSTWHRVQTAVQSYTDAFPDDRFGAFEVFTAMALAHFSDRRVQTVISEAGIGGRYDSTRVIPGELVGLTSLDLEHTALLGDRLDQIAFDKADLCPDHGTLIAGAHLDPEVLRRLKGYLEIRRIQLVSVGDHCRLLRVEPAPSGQTIDLQVGDRLFEDLRIGLAGRFQGWNAALAILLVEAWIDRHLELTRVQIDAALRSGLENAYLPGRFEKVLHDPEVFVDGGHTPETAKALVEAVEQWIDTPVLLVVGVSRDKNAEQLVPTLLECAAAVICTRAWHRGSPVERIERIVDATRPDLPTWRAETLEQAMEQALDEARRRGWTVLVAGGLFLSIEATEVLNGRDPRALKFF